MRDARCLHALAHGHVGAAIDHNALTVLLLPFVIAAWVGVGIAAVRGRSARSCGCRRGRGGRSPARSPCSGSSGTSPPVFAWMAP